SPASAGTGSTVTISGSGFFNVSSVKFGGVLSTSTVVNSVNSITAVVGAGATGDVSVTTQGATGVLSGFSFISPVTGITSVSPAVGSNGTIVTITGYNFTGASSVSFGGTAAASF